MEANIIAIGNSKGIRFKKDILEKYNFQDKVELILEEDYLIIRPIRQTQARAGWEKAFAAMHQNGEDNLLIDSILDEKDWG